MARTPSISVVVPVYNEPDWIVRSVSRVAEELLSSRWRDPEIVIVDDGSTDDTSRVVDQLSVGVPLRVIHQDNRGRFEARRTGLQAARGEFVLFVDARVLVDVGSLDVAIDRIATGAEVWNGHCNVSLSGNVFAYFWDAVARIFWARYLSNPKTTSYGLEEFDAFPKGTTCFLGPRRLLLEGYAAFTSYYTEARHVNDDTTLIRLIAGQSRIWISPDFSCHYESRDTLRRFVPHVYHRGIVLVDGHLRRGAQLAPAIVAFYPVSLAVVLATGRWRSAPLVALAAAAAGAAGAGMVRRLPAGHVVALAVVTPIFAVPYGLGIWMGAALALRTRMARQPREVEP
jgi:hypothetical protein